MLINYSNYLFSGFLLFTIILYLCVGYAYHLNAQRVDDDPKKLTSPLAIVPLAPVTWNLLIIGFISLFIIKVLIYSVFLILFTITLLVIRKPFLLERLKKVAAPIGGKLLQANLLMVKLAFGGQKKTQAT